MMSSRCARSVRSDGKSKPPFGSPAKLSAARSMSAGPCTGTTAGRIASAGAADSHWRAYAAPAGLSGLNRRAARVRCGAICFRISGSLPKTESSGAAKPVMLPPGRARLVMPCPSGSVTQTNTVGIDRRRLLNDRQDAPAGHDDHIRPEADELRRVGSQAFQIIGRPPFMESEILALDPAALAELLLECGNAHLQLRVALGVRHQDPDRTPAVVLSPRRERPCRRGAKPGDDLPPPHEHLVTNAREATPATASESRGVAGRREPRRHRGILRLRHQQRPVDALLGRPPYASPASVRKGGRAV